MKKIILLSCLSLAPFSLKCFAMEEQFESGTGNKAKRASSREILTKQDSFTTSEGSLYLDRYLVNANNTDKGKFIDLEELRQILKTAENLNSDILKIQNNTKIMPEKIGVPNTNTLPIVQDRVAMANSEDSILDAYVVHSNKQVPDDSSIVDNKIDTNITYVRKTEGGNLLNNTTNNKERKKIKKRLSLNTQQTKEKTRNRSLSLSLDKKTPFFEKKEKGPEEK